jgi:hypothetical protein
VLDRRVHVFAVEAVDLLRRLGHDVLGLLIDRTEGSLAELVRQLAAASVAEIATAADLERLVGDRFGSEHPLTSAVRFRLFGTASLEVPDPAEEPEPAGTQDRYRSPAGVRYLPDVHDIEQAVRAAAGDGFPGPRYSYLRWPAHPRPVRVDPPIAELLRCFDGGRSLSAVLATLGADPRSRPDWLAELLEAGLLQPVPSLAVPV